MHACFLACERDLARLEKLGGCDDRLPCDREGQRRENDGPELIEPAR
jgi:hypothetical protein